MTKSKLAFTCLLTASILSPMCVNALTQQEAANIAAGSQAQATLTAEQKQAGLIKLVQEIDALKAQIALKKSELSSDKTMRTVTLTITTAGSLVIGYLLFARSEAGMRGLENIFYSALVGAGTVPFAAMSYSLNQQVNLSVDQIDRLTQQLSEAQKQFGLQLSKLN